MEKKKEAKGPIRNYEYDRNQPRQRYDDKGIPRRIKPHLRKEREDIKVTVDTEIPPMPGKSEMLGKPNWELEYKKDYEKLTKNLREISKEKVICLEMCRVSYIELSGE
jgi:hypothetical protein